MIVKHSRVLIITILAVFAGGLFTGAARSDYQAATPAATAAASPVAATPVGTPGAAIKPIVRAQVNGTDAVGAAGSYCWPIAGADSPCVIVDDPQLTTPIAVKVGDKVTFTVDPAPAKLDTFKATLLDDNDTSGNPLVIDLSATQGVYTVDSTLTNGTHRVQIDAIYPADTSGSQNFVEYIFALDVSGGVAATSVATAAETAGATSGALIIKSTEVPAPTTIATNEVVTAPATIAASAATKPATAVPTKVRATPTLVPTIVPTTAPIEATPTEVAPAPATEPTTTVPGSISLSDLAPALTITASGQSYTPVAISAVIQATDGTQITITRPVNTNAPYIRATTGADAQIAFTGPHPTSENVSLASSDGTKLLGRRSVVPDNLVLYALPTTPGIYVITVEVTWPSGQASYYFRAAIS